MKSLDEIFGELGTDNAPGQEVRQTTQQCDDQKKGETLAGVPVDFSHGDVDAHPPTPGALEAWNQGFERGAAQAYTEYRGLDALRQRVSQDVAAFTGAPVDYTSELIITPGTQGALFLALGAVVTHGTKVVVIEPDYFANRKLVTFFGGIVMHVPLNYGDDESNRGPDLNALEKAFKDGAEVLIFSTPNNPTGTVTATHVIAQIATLAQTYDVTVVVDQLYARMQYVAEDSYAHLRADQNAPKNIITILGPSKTESLSGFRLGVAFGTAVLVDRMEKLQALVSLRAAGYNQAALETWFREPEGWLQDRIAAHQAIRDDLLRLFNDAGLRTERPNAGSYLYPRLPELAISLNDFVRFLREQAGVIVTPGTEFARQDTDRIRLNFSQDHQASVAAAQRIIALAKRYAR
ncbi:pyridoxal phosphate-dependent aminotransferase [uncultured Tateyamaria sp.]|uniref:pyridoxal phosphate-dependent aminotransferase n=1 Tax=uncultured Tateyamaria sp. TaxID=455651 RepID=UPI002637AFCC|nr:pyridoxal phosphate-dependent aminotransferase [uncultured Tateyamaria sp.]